MGKKELGDIIFAAYREVGLGRTTVFLDALKDFGFRYSTQGGVSVGIEDMEIPAEKDRSSARPRRTWRASPAPTPTA
jgi:DNA-directed RNA polymerase subunit beta'